MIEYLAIFPPLVAFVVAFLFGKHLGERLVQLITCAGVITAAFCSCALFVDVVLGHDPRTVTIMNWITSGTLSVDWALRMDQLAVVMMCVVTIVSSCVHVYSTEYMHEDECKSRFMSYLSLFTFAMLMLVTADNLIQLFFGWEGVGVASYLLIGFWNYKDSANAAAIKAFLVNRVGDFGLALGVFACFKLFGTVQFDGMFALAEGLKDARFDFFGFDLPALTTTCLLLFVGAMGKSAQLGLHTWLPDAMEGPTPVSALIHAATMVTAGVFMVARMSPVFEYAPDALMVVCVIGACTAFVAATIGLTQFDIKRVIAYSTMSQLGYMFFALGVSAYGAAIFHLMTHAFFKALLFLGAGSVIHALHHEQDMRNMGGVWKKIPATYVLMWIGSLALAGIPFFAGYYSKDIMLEAAFSDHTWFGTFAYWMGIAAAFMTAFYSGRLLFMTFHGRPRMDHHTFDHAHESPPAMLTPLIILSIGALFAGFLGYEGFVGGTEKHEIVAEAQSAEVEHEAVINNAPVVEENPHGEELNRFTFWGDAIKVLPGQDTLETAHHVPHWVKLLPTVMGVLGLFFSWVFYSLRPGLPAKVVGTFSALHTLFFRKWFFDEIYNAVFVKNAICAGKVFWKTDKNVVDGIGPDGLAARSLDVSGVLKKMQSGYVFHYAFVMIIGVVSFVSWFFYQYAG
ncbi:MAG: NADH-quinone oxidoreductase subunit L [Micavibrio aeruginosavorus]|uniref:NADH-quinone oxidoreductase subunit L n=1 Tax=Micavibrio aeruginosavorus TaxID=349221 RepID=A0A2W5MZ16_9BACT|nr:MAG: NADH-quinone oxidoreductase subunit L [Micavibrio aeruginosavorus]